MVQVDRLEEVRDRCNQLEPSRLPVVQTDCTGMARLSVWGQAGLRAGRRFDSAPGPEDWVFICKMGSPGHGSGTGKARTRLTEGSTVVHLGERPSELRQGILPAKAN